MTFGEAQRLTRQRELLAADLPPFIESKERLTQGAACIISRLGLLCAPAGKITVSETVGGVTCTSKQDHPGKAAVATLRTAAEKLSAACCAFEPGCEQAVLSNTDDVEACLETFIIAVPQLATNYYIGPIRAAVQSIRSQLQLVSKASRR